MKEALGNYMAMACSVDGLCLTDSSYNLVVETYPWVRDLALNYVQQYGQRVLNIAQTGKKPRFIFTPFQVNTATCNPRLLCGQLIQFANKQDLNHIIIPRPNNYDEIKSILHEELDDRFIVMVDDPKYLNIVDGEVDDGEDYPNLDDVTPSVVAQNSFVATSACVTGPRPKNCYGYSAPDKWNALQNKIYACCKQLYDEFGVRTFGSGCAQGVDMSFFFCIQYIKSQHPEVKNVLYRPFATHGSNFKTFGAFNINEYNQMLVQAGDDIVQLAPNVTNPDRSLASKCLLDRNTIMIDAHDYVIGVYGGDKELIKNSTFAHSGTLHALRYAYSKSKKIILINPDTLQAERFNF